MIEYATDTYQVFNFSGAQVFRQFAMSGRFITAIIGYIVKLMNLSENAIYWGSSILAIIFVLLSIYKLYKIIRKDVKNKILRILIPILIVINPFSIELFLYIEKGIMIFGILMSIYAVDNLIKYWYIPTFIVLAIIGGVLFYINTPKGKYNFHYFKYKAPIFGQLIFALDFSRFLRAMLLNLKNGMRIQDSIEVSKNVINNYVMRSMIETSINNILTGTSWIEPFEKSGLAKPMITEMLKIGMQTDLTEMMEKLVEYMQIDIDNIMNKIMKTLPQVVYAIVGVVLIFFVIVVLVPCIQVYMGNFLFSAYGV